MSRYIDADELERKYMSADYMDNDTAYDVIAELDTAPHIDIVRCKECKCFNHFEDKEHGEWNTCERHMIFMNPDDYCSYGERKATEITTDCSWK